MVKRLFNSVLAVEPQERMKLLFLSMCYFCIIVAYTVTRDMREIIFTAVVGKDYIPLAGMLGMVVFIAPLFLYSKMVDRMRRYQLLCAVSLFYGIVGLIFAFFLADPAIGMANTNQSVYRIYGWLFYFFIEGYAPFVVSVFWAFANSITNQEAAKKNYGLMVGASKIGGLVASAFAIIVLNWTSHVALSRASDVVNHQIILVTASLMSLVVPVVVIMLMRTVPGRYMHGYEAAYKIEKERHKRGSSETGVWSGISMLVKSPYVFGMFSIIFFYEVINKVLSYQRICAASNQASCVSDMSTYLYATTFIMHLLGLLISVFGTRFLLETFGEKVCLMLIPAIDFVLLIYCVINYQPFALVVMGTISKAVHYALSFPIKESLYIPTIKEIKFKSKSWIDTFGSKFARATGSTFNSLVCWLSPAVFFPVNLLFLATVTGMWMTVAFFLGKRYERAISNNEVIGADIIEDLGETVEGASR